MGLCESTDTMATTTPSSTAARSGTCVSKNAPPATTNPRVGQRALSSPQLCASPTPPMASPSRRGGSIVHTTMPIPPSPCMSFISGADEAPPLSRAGAGGAAAAPTQPLLPDPGLARATGGDTVTPTSLSAPSMGSAKGLRRSPYIICDLSSLAHIPPHRMGASSQGKGHARTPSRKESESVLA